MAGKKIFVTQKILDTLYDEGKAKVEGNILTLLKKGGVSYELVPAFKFLFVADESPDKLNLVGKVFTEKELKKINADIYMDSVIVKDVPYQVEPGFVGIPLTGSSEGKDEPSDADLLQEYLLKIL